MDDIRLYSEQIICIGKALNLNYLSVNSESDDPIMDTIYT